MGKVTVTLELTPEEADFLQSAGAYAMLQMGDDVPSKEEIQNLLIRLGYYSQAKRQERE